MGSSPKPWVAAAALAAAVILFAVGWWARAASGRAQRFAVVHDQGNEEVLDTRTGTLYWVAGKSVMSANLPGATMWERPLKKRLPAP